MTRTSAAVAALRAADPAAGVPDGLDEDARADLARIVATPRPARAEAAALRRAPARRVPRRAFAVGLALAGLTAVVLVVPSVVPFGPGGDRRAYAATARPADRPGRCRVRPGGA
jgi:hypothetical protein